MQRHHGKCRKEPCQQIAVHQQNAEIHHIKTEKCRIAAESVNTACDQLRFILVGYACSPAILHAKDGEQKNLITQHSNAEAGETDICREMIPSEYICLH